MLRIALLALFVFAAAAGGLFARRIYLERTPPTGSSEFYVGGQKLLVEKAMVRDPDLRQGGAFNRLDLVLNWSDFRGGAGGSQIQNRDALVFVALEDATTRASKPGDIDPAERPVDLYARFLAKDAWSNPGGLVMRRFRPGTPYEGEELYLSTPDERIFAARCPQANTQPGPGDQCLWQTRIGGLDLQVRFSPTLLVSWERLAGGIRQAIPRLEKREAKG